MSTYSQNNQGHRMDQNEGSYKATAVAFILIAVMLIVLAVMNHYGMLPSK